MGVRPKKTQVGTQDRTPGPGSNTGGTREGHRWASSPEGERHGHEQAFTADLPPHAAALSPGPRGRASPASASRSAPLKTCSCCSLTQPRVRRRLETKPTAAAISGTMSTRGPPRRWLWRWLMPGSGTVRARRCYGATLGSARSTPPAPRRDLIGQSGEASSRRRPPLGEGARYANSTWPQRSGRSDVAAGGGAVTGGLFLGLTWEEEEGDGARRPRLPAPPCSVAAAPLGAGGGSGGPGSCRCPRWPAGGGRAGQGPTPGPPEPPSQSRIGPCGPRRPREADVGAPRLLPGPWSGSPGCWRRAGSRPGLAAPRSPAGPQPQGTPGHRYRQGQAPSPPHQRRSSRAASTTEHNASGGWGEGSSSPSHWQVTYWNRSGVTGASVRGWVSPTAPRSCALLPRLWPTQCWIGVGVFSTSVQQVSADLQWHGSVTQGSARQWPVPEAWPFLPSCLQQTVGSGPLHRGLLSPAVYRRVSITKFPFPRHIHRSLLPAQGQTLSRDPRSVQGELAITCAVPDRWGRRGGTPPEPHSPHRLRSVCGEGRGQTPQDPVPPSSKSQAGGRAGGGGCRAEDMSDHGAGRASQGKHGAEPSVLSCLRPAQQEGRGEPVQAVRGPDA